MDENKPSSRLRRQAETRQALLVTAEESFCRDGYAATSLERIAKAAGFTTGAIYANFSSKERLFLALHEHRAQRFGATSGDWIPPGASLEVRLHAFGLHVGELAKENRAWALVAAEFWAQAARRPELAAELVEVHARNRADFAEVIRAVVSPDAVDEAMLQQTAYQAIGLLEGLAIQTYVDDSADFVALFAEGFQRLVSTALGRDKAARPSKAATR